MRFFLPKIRIDKLLVERGLASSRARAQALILAGRVLVDEQKMDKAGTSVDESAVIRLLGEDVRYVSRGGLKLEHALAHWKIDVRGASCMDVGASTGGFTDCLLQHGAAFVLAIDTGYGQIDVRLRDDRRVRLLEKTNARYLEAAQVPERIELVAMDDEQLAPVGGDMDAFVRNAHLAEIEFEIVAHEFVVIAGNEGDRGALARLAQ